MPGVSVPTPYPTSPYYSIPQSSLLINPNTPGFLKRIDVGDVNGDGREDIIVDLTPVGSSGIAGLPEVHRVVVFDGYTGSLLFGINLPGSATGPYVPIAYLDDLNGDGSGEVGIGNAFVSTGIGGGSVNVYSGAAGTLLYTITSPTTNLIFGTDLIALNGDTNGNGILDFAVGTFASIPVSAPATLYIYDGSGSLIRALSPPNPFANSNFGVPGTVAAGGDMNFDGAPEIIVGAPNLGAIGTAGPSTVYVFSGATGNLLYNFNQGSTYTPLYGVQVDGGTDYNNDIYPDIVVLDSDSNNILIFSGFDGSPLSTFAVWGSSGASIIGHGDDSVNGDAEPEITMNSYPTYITNEIVNSNPISPYTYIWNTGGGGPWGSSLGDVDGDGLNEIVKMVNLNNPSPLLPFIARIDVLKLGGVYSYGSGMSATWAPVQGFASQGTVSIIGLNPLQQVCVAISGAPLNPGVPLPGSGTLDTLDIDPNNANSVLLCGLQADNIGTINIPLSIQFPPPGTKFYVEFVWQDPNVQGVNGIRSSTAFELTSLP